VLFSEANLEGTMGSFGLGLTGGLMIIIACLMPPARAQDKSAPPDFSLHHGVGWASAEGNGPNFSPVPGKVAPMTNDPAHPYVPNGRGRQATFRIGDVSNPNLKPWIKELMKKDNEEVLAGKPAFTARSSCMPAGVPAFMAYGGGDEPIYFVQTPKTVWMIYQGNQEVRRIYLDVPHSENPRPSWYGESVGHYEGDTLIIDTIAQNTHTVLDFYRTPHTDKLHVVERWRKIENGRFIEVVFTVDDSDSFYEPWTATRRYRRVEHEMIEEPCAENNQHFEWHIPVADKPDF
jgi:hypothetical protein